MGLVRFALTIFILRYLRVFYLQSWVSWLHSMYSNSMGLYTEGSGLNESFSCENKFGSC
jgi:hypothetical protein